MEFKAICFKHRSTRGKKVGVVYNIRPGAVEAKPLYGRASFIPLANYLIRQGFNREASIWYEEEAIKATKPYSSFMLLQRALKEIDQALEDYDRFDQLNKVVVDLASTNPNVARIYCVAMTLHMIACIKSRLQVGNTTVGELVKKYLYRIYEEIGKLGGGPSYWFQLLHELYLHLMFTNTVPLKTVGHMESFYTSHRERLGLSAVQGYFIHDIARELVDQFEKGMIAERDYDTAMLWASERNPGVANLTLGQYHKITVRQKPGDERTLVVQFVDDVTKRVDALQRWLEKMGIKVRRESPTSLVFEVPYEKQSDVARALVTLTSIDFTNQWLDKVTSAPDLESAYRIKSKIVRFH